jgi:hypothetical protein
MAAHDGPANVSLVRRPVIPVALYRVRINTEPADKVEDCWVADCGQFSIHEFSHGLPIYQSRRARMPNPSLLSLRSLRDVTRFSFAS